MKGRSLLVCGVVMTSLGLLSYDASAHWRRGGGLFHRCRPAPCPQPTYPCVPVGPEVSQPPTVDPDEQEFGADLPKLEPLPKLPDLPSIESLRPKLD
jgi:hypothetical protein